MVPVSGSWVRRIGCELSDDSGDHPAEPLRLAGDWFLLRKDCVDKAATLFRRWYVDQGRPVVDRIVSEYSKRIAKPTKVDLRDIGFRWGSCTTEGRVLVSWRAIQLPMDAMEYVVAHEMVHLLHRNHDQDFWNQLRKVMPDCDDRKNWLAKNGDTFAAEF